MATIGMIEEFNTSNPADWESYIQRLHFFMIANGIAQDERKRATFLSVCGNATFVIARSLVAPNSLEDSTFNRIVSLLTDHFNPKPSEIVQRFRFHKREQQPGEGIATYLAELRKLAEHCQFGNTLEIMLRDRLVCGIRDEAVQRRLLAEVDLTFKKTFDIILAAETTATQVLELRNCSFGSTVTEVNAVQHKNSIGGRKNSRTTEKASQQEIGKQKQQRNFLKRACFRCGDQHDPYSCRFANSSCNFCRIVGHLEKVCLLKSRKLQQRANAVENLQECDQEVEAD